MYIVLGGTGHVGSATVAGLLKRGEAVTLVTRGGAVAEEWKARGARIAIADVRDVESLRRVFKEGKRLLLVNPPADPATDTDAEERRTGSSIALALEGSELERIVVQSTYGARPGERIGDLGTLYELERAVRARSMTATMLRAAYFMSNWDFALETALKDGVVQSLFPADFRLAMVAPTDIGELAARLLTDPAEPGPLHHVEGPERYTPSQVASAFGNALGKRVSLVTIPRSEWKSTFESMGFSKPAAESYVGMTSVTVDEEYALADSPERGKVSLEQYVAELVRSIPVSQ
jgi:uncharacterized protein YbjT (DUF2867 family)